jgi:hypothetical protein
MQISIHRAFPATSRAHHSSNLRRGAANLTKCLGNCQELILTDGEHSKSLRTLGAIKSIATSNVAGLPITDTPGALRSWIKRLGDHLHFLSINLRRAEVGDKAQAQLLELRGGRSPAETIKSFRISLSRTLVCNLVRPSVATADHRRLRIEPAVCVSKSAWNFRRPSVQPLQTPSRCLTKRHGYAAADAF